MLLANCSTVASPGTEIWSNDIGWSVRSFKGFEAKEYFKEIADMRIGLFAHYPYLYEGNYENERGCLETYFRSPHSDILLLFDGDRVAGFAHSIPLDEEMSELQNPFLAQGQEVKNYLYIGEGMLYPAYRGKGILDIFRNYYEQAARDNGYKNIVFMMVKRAPDHPLKPDGYRVLDQLCRRYGYEKMADYDIKLSWQQVDTHAPEENILEIWNKNLATA